MSEVVYTLRGIEPTDFEAFAEIVNHEIRHGWANFRTTEQSAEDWRQEWASSHARYPWWVAVAPDGQVVGFAHGHAYNPREAYDWCAEVTVYIHHAHHRQGLGRKLYDRLLPQLRAQGFHSVMAGISLPNLGSVRLHEGFGFVRCCTVKKAGWKMGGWHDVGYWQLMFEAGDVAPAPLKAPEEV